MKAPPYTRSHQLLFKFPAGGNRNSGRQPSPRLRNEASMPIRLASRSRPIGPQEEQESYHLSPENDRRHSLDRQPKGVSDAVGPRRILEKEAELTMIHDVVHRPNSVEARVPPLRGPCRRPPLFRGDDSSAKVKSDNGHKPNEAGEVILYFLLSHLPDRKAKELRASVMVTFQPFSGL